MKPLISLLFLLVLGCDLRNPACVAEGVRNEAHTYSTWTPVRTNTYEIIMGRTCSYCGWIQIRQAYDTMP